MTALKNLFDPARVQEIQQRLSHLQPDAPAQWGAMTPAQALAHCSGGLQMTTGEIRPPRKFIGRILGPIIKPLALRDDEPMRRNSPTVDEILFLDDRDLDTERQRLLTLLDHLAAAGPAICTTYPHAFFGPLTPEQWGILMYKHLDHHLRQFGA
jgi:hypothetical protein